MSMAINPFGSNSSFPSIAQGKLSEKYYLVLKDHTEEEEALRNLLTSSGIKDNSSSFGIMPIYEMVEELIKERDKLLTELKESKEFLVKIKYKN